MQIQHQINQAIIPTKSPNDPRSYQAIELNNGIKILFIEDTSLEKSACSISVGVGSLEDPQRSLGLAHFLQHMLFMGSQKFPSHNQYSSFINQNSGFDNAYTSDVQTNYFFQIANKAFVLAVQRITNFFTGALLTESCITKQTQAVHEEYVLWTNDDNCRKWEIIHRLAKGPYSRFSIGNNTTLGHSDIRKDLVTFYQTKYSSNRINAVLCSSFSIQQMKKQLLPYFEEIQNKNLAKNVYQPFYEAQNIGKFVRMQSIKEQTIMQFFWPVQQLKNDYKKHADEYITHILGHQGKNSLFSLLKTKGFAFGITSYTHELASQCLIGLQIKLTQQGAESYQQVYNIVMDYTSSLKPNKEIFEQLKNQKQISFKFKQKTQTYHYVCQLSGNMHDKPLQEILDWKYLFQQFNEQFLKNVLSKLNPFNVIVVYSNAQQIQQAITEQYLGAKYKIQELPQRKIQIKNFQPLRKNQFLPVNIDLHQANQDSWKPRKISENIVFLKDNTFKVCKGGVKIQLHGMKNPTLREFYSQYLQSLLKQITYDAQTLHLQIEYDNEDAIQIQIFGFNDTVVRLIQKIGQNLVSIHQSENSQRLFTTAQDKLLQDYQNFLCSQVDQIAQTILHNLLINQNIDIHQTIQIIEQYQYPTQTQQFLEFLNHCTLSWIFVGNFHQQQSIQIAKVFQQNLKCTKKIHNQQIKCLKVDQHVKHLTSLPSQQISTSGCIVYYSAGQYSQKLFYTLHLLKNHVEQPFFNELRTEKQLAYFLTTRILNVRGVLGIYFILISSSKDPDHISKQIKKFVQNFMSKMDTQLTEQKIQNLRQSVKTKFSVPHNNLKGLFDFTCQQIQQSTFYFNRKEKVELEKHLNSIEKELLIQKWKQISKNALQIHVLAKNHQEEFLKLSNQDQYKKFSQIKKLQSFNDIVSERKHHF